MKKSWFIGMVLVVISLNGNAQTNVSSLKCGSYAMRQDTDAKDTMALIHYCYYNANLPFQRTVNEAIFAYLDVSWGQSGMPSEIVMNDGVFSDYVAAFVADYEATVDDYEDMPNWSLEMNIEVDETTLNTFVICSMSDYNYSGGAHGNANQKYVMIDKTTGDKLYLETICKNIQSLTKRVEPYFQKAYEFPENPNYEEIGLSFENNKFQLATNFWFDKNNLYFYYNQYEIGPYSAGIFEVAIPLSEVQDLFTIQF